MRRPAARGRKDATQATIRDALIRAGCYVLDLSAVGGGCPDLLVYHLRVGLRLVEVKTRAGKLKPSQVAFARRWPVSVARTPEDALRAMGFEVTG